MQSALVRTVAPVLEPLTIREVERHLRLGSSNAEPAPDAPTVALAGAGAGNVDNGAHRYRVTFVTADGETDGGTISSAVTVADKTTNGKVAISAIPLGGSAVTSRKLYRTTAGGTSYLLLATIADNTTTTYTDNIADSALGVGVPTTNTTSDPELLALLQEAREALEKQFGRAFLTQTWRLSLDRFPSACDYPNHPLAHREIRLPMPVLQSVSSITYIDTDGNQQTLATSVYDVDTDGFPGRVFLKYGQSWPIARYQPNSVVITFVAGFASAALVPSTWKAATKLMIGHLNENREAVVVDSRAADVTVPKGVDDLMWPDRHIEVA